MTLPLRFRPYLRPMVWGGRRLADVLGKPLPDAESYGEAWEISDHESHHSQLHDGRTLRDLMKQPAALLGDPSATVFPWLVKFLDACDWLSVQVHPDEEAVKRLWPGEGSKTEAWFILDACPGSRVYAGLKHGVDEPQLRRAVADGSVADCLHSFEPRPGDCLFLPAGTVHAVGGGVLIAEVQQTSDATFRLFDWNRRDSQGRSRALHIEEALACINWHIGPVDPVRATGYPASRATWQRLVSCRYFELDYLCRTELFSLGGAGTMQTAIGLHGQASLRTARGLVWLGAGETMVLPANMPATPCRPEGGPVGMLMATLPVRERIAA